jgi:hypothetical protein
VISDEELVVIGARADAATPGPWAALLQSGGAEVLTVPQAGESLCIAMMVLAEDSAADDNAHFISDARTYVPRLVESHLAANARITELERLVDGLQRVVKALDDVIDGQEAR